MDKYSWDREGMYLDNKEGHYVWHKDIENILDEIKKLAFRQEYNEIIELCENEINK